MCLGCCLSSVSAESPHPPRTWGHGAQPAGHEGHVPAPPLGEPLVSEHLLLGVLFLPISQVGKLRQHQVSNPRSLVSHLASRLCESVRAEGALPGCF